MKRLLVLIFSICLALGSKADNTKGILIELKGEKDKGDSVKIEYFSLDPLKNVSFQKTIPLKRQASQLILKVDCNVNLTIYSGDSLVIGQLLLLPGDRMSITRLGGIVSVHSESVNYRVKLNLDDQLKRVSRPHNPKFYKSKSISDYLEWNEYFKRKMNAVDSIMTIYQPKISAEVYQYCRLMYLMAIQEKRHDKFRGLYALHIKGDPSVTSDDLCNIFDSTFFYKPIEWMRRQSISGAADHGIVKDLLEREYRYPRDKEEVGKDADGRVLSYYALARKLYRGVVWESYLREFMSSVVLYQGIYESRKYSAACESLLANYYSEPHPKFYVDQVRATEKKYRTQRVFKGLPAVFFSLMDEHGKRISLKDFENQTVLINFWESSGKTSAYHLSKLKSLSDSFQGAKRLVFLNVSFEKDKAKWQQQIKMAGFDNRIINLFTEGKGKDHHVVKDYRTNGKPGMVLIGKNGFIQFNGYLEANAAGHVERLIAKELALANDGPYVLQDGVYSIVNHAVVEQPKAIKGEQVRVGTDDVNKHFDVQLLGNHENQRSVSERPQKLIAFSDIEGNFDALRKLLQANKVIDENFHWIFGSGHLVFAGDMFDRGEQVTECLWLIYSLEKKAELSGGKVHFILGNHEIMNLSGNSRYAKPKYLNNAKALKKTYAELYSERSELGSWLRSKNVIEKVGDIVFMHGGFSEEMLELSMTIPQINDKGRPYYDRDTVASKSSDRQLSVLYGTKTSPFWYRNYYLAAPMKVYSNCDTLYRTLEETVNKTLKSFDAKHIVTGHTIVGDTISTHFNSKVINTDVRHAYGRIEALLIEGNSFYRVNDKGERKLLFRDPEEKDKAKK